MKVSAQQASGLLRDPARLTGFLFYGDDPGLVRERSAAAVRAGAGDRPLVFCETVLTRDEHKMLAEAALSEPLGGGRRIVRVQDAGDAIVAALEKLSSGVSRALIVVEAGSLLARSKLRGFAERHAGWAAVACYPETGRVAAAEIEAALGRDGIRLAPDALAFLADELSGDVMRRKAEIEKLALFALDSGTVTLAIARESCADGTDATLGMAVGAALSGRLAEAEALLASLEREGATGPGLLAVLSGQVHRLLRIRSQTEAGRPMEEALRGLQPPVFPSQVGAVARDVERWTVSALEGVLRGVRDADRACKRAGSVDFAIAARLLLSIAARRSGSGGVSAV